MNISNDILHFLKLDSVFYCKSQLSGNWGIKLPEFKNTSMFHVVTSGECIVRIGKKNIKLSAGSLIFTPRSVGHSLLNNSKTKAVDLFSLPCKQIGPCYETLNLGDQDKNLTTMLCGVVKLQHPAANRLIEAMPDYILINNSDSPYSNWLNDIVRLIAIEANDKLLGGETVLTRLADVLVIHILRKWISQDGKNKSSWIHALSDEKIGKALQLIHNHPERKWTIENLGKEVGMSRSAFSNKFSELLNEPMLQYLTKWRMNLAYMRLANGENFSIDMVEELGYQSESAFRKVFKKTLHINIGDIKTENTAIYSI